ncbi:MAG: tetratricopeptide repeat protein [Balneolaceae bacterium]|nr:tetratricopeptide repeat protein [Balneolaceae bacterium]
MNTYKYWEEIEKVIDEALLLEEEFRESFIKKKCGQNPDLLTEALEYFSFIKKAEDHNFLQSDSLNTSNLFHDLDFSSLTDIKNNVIGRAIGPYQITKLIGEGGMGSVYLGERNDGEFQQHVAIKFLRGGFFSSYMRKRFKNEKNILSRLNHPNITRLLDGGITDDGTPFLIMEYVNGEPIDEYCFKNKLRIDDRLHLFLQIAGAIQYAHSKLIIHRDLKPENIFVTKEGRIKVMDFGIAKFLSPDSEDSSPIQTREGQYVASFNFAAPEQLFSNESTTTTDVYGLGALLYLLLTGQYPLRLNGYSLSEIESVILHTEPKKPGKITDSTIGDIPADLEAIIMKALRKEPDQRYSSVEMMADDIKRYQNELPVDARHATFGYRSGKFIRRHRSKIAAAVLLIAGLSGIIIYYTTQITAERNAAQHEAERAGAINQFLIDVFETADPEVNRGEQITANEMLNRGVEMAAGLTSQPELQIDMLTVAGEIYLSLGDYDSAFDVTEKALTQAQKLYGEEHVVVAGILNSMGTVLRNNGDYTAAKQYILEALEQRRSLLGNEHPETAASLNNLGVTLRLLGEYEQAQSLYEDALEIRRSVLGNQHPDVAKSLNSLGALFSILGKYEQAHKAHEEALEIRRSALGNLHSDVALSLGNLGIVFSNLGDNEQALVMFEEALVIQQSILGNLHPRVAESLNNLGVFLVSLEEYEQAIEAHKEALEIRREVFGNRHPNIASSLNNLGAALRFAGHLPEARSTLEKAVELQRELLGEEHPSFAISLTSLAFTLRQKGDYEKAHIMFEEALIIQLSALGNLHPRVATLLILFGATLRELGEYEQAFSMYEEALHIRRTLLGDQHPSVAVVLNSLGILLIRLEEYEQAIEAHKEALEIRREVFGDRHPSFALSLNNLGAALRFAGHLREARSTLEKTVELRRELLGEEHPSFAISLTSLATTLQLKGDYKTAEKLLHQALDIQQATLPKDHQRKAVTKSLLGASLAARGQYSEAENLLKEGYQTLSSQLNPEDIGVQQAKNRLEEFYREHGQP